MKVFCGLREILCDISAIFTDRQAKRTVCFFRWRWAVPIINALSAICIRTSTERPEALDKACFFLAGIDERSLLQAVDNAIEMNKENDFGTPVPDYIDENVSTKVVKLIQSYTGVVNKMVWRKTNEKNWFKK